MRPTTDTAAATKRQAQTREAMTTARRRRRAMAASQTEREAEIERLNESEGRLADIRYHLNAAAGLAHGSPIAQEKIRELERQFEEALACTSRRLNDIDPTR